MHPSGFFEILVTSLKDLEGLNPKTQAVRIGATVGDRKRMVLQETALSSGIKVSEHPLCRNKRDETEKGRCKTVFCGPEEKR